MYGEMVNGFSSDGAKVKEKRIDANKNATINEIAAESDPQQKQQPFKNGSISELSRANDRRYGLVINELFNFLRICFRQFLIFLIDF